MQADRCSDYVCQSCPPLRRKRTGSGRRSETRAFRKTRALCRTCAHVTTQSKTRLTLPQASASHHRRQNPPTGVKHPLRGKRHHCDWGHEGSQWEPSSPLRARWVTVTPPAPPPARRTASEMGPSAALCRPPFGSPRASDTAFSGLSLSGNEHPPEIANFIRF